jgi:Ca2+-transporting ATPase
MTLRGENEPTRKQSETINSYQEESISEIKNLVFMGTLVRNGHGSAVVFGTGEKTELGSVMKMLKEVFFDLFNNRLKNQRPHCRRK